jgi:hypothetical protein
MKLKNGLVSGMLLSVVFMAAGTSLWADNANDLRTSENGRFLVHGDGSAFFPVADTAWAIAWRLRRNEVEHYLGHRKEQKFNTIALVSFPSYEGGKITANVYGDYPFEVESGVWNPRHPITTPGDNPENADEYDYWDHLQYIIDAADSKGMHVVLLPAWGSYVAGSYVSGAPTPDVIFNVGSAYAYGCWIGQRFAHKKNIIWMMGGDRSPVYEGRDYRDVFRAMAEGVADGVNGINQQDGTADYSTTLMSYHPRKWHPNSSEWFHNDLWLDFNSIQDQPKDQVVATSLDYGLAPAKPTWLFEGGYEFRTRGESAYTDWQIRFQSYQTVFAGGFGITYGSMNVYHCGGGAAALDEPVESGQTNTFEASLDEAGAMDMQHLFNLMTSMTNEQFLERIPDQSLIDGDEGGLDVGEGIRSNRLQATRGTKGDYAMIYSANGRNIRVKMDRLAPRFMNAYWFNPRNGKWWIGESEFAGQKAFTENVASGAAAPAQEFDPPGSTEDNNDWVLVLKAVK